MILVTDKYGVSRVDKNSPNEFLTYPEIGQSEYLIAFKNYTKIYLSYFLFMYMSQVSTNMELAKERGYFNEPNVYDFTWDTLLK